jgi:1-deoxy-D-xylulose 5-phosphate reductoisomerase
VTRFAISPDELSEESEQRSSTHVEDGSKITIDSATLMNKGLRSSRHGGCSMYPLNRSMSSSTRSQSLPLELRDGSVIAQLSVTDTVAVPNAHVPIPAVERLLPSST